MMKKGINIWSFQENISLQTACDIAKKAGFDGIEYSISLEGELGINRSNAEVAAVRTMTADAGLAITSLATPLCWNFPCTSSNPAIVQKGNDIIRRQIEMAVLLGVDTILVVPGFVGADHVPGSEVIPYDVAYTRALEVIGGLAPYAEQNGITIALENCWTKFLLSPLEFRDFIDKINSPNVKAYFDVANVLQTGYPEHWISILGNRIKKVHFKDYKKTPGGIDCFCNLLTGDVNFPAVVAALEGIGYDDYCIAEIIPHYIHYPEKTIYDASSAMDYILGRVT